MEKQAQPESYLWVEERAIESIEACLCMMEPNACVAALRLLGFAIYAATH